MAWQDEVANKRQLQRQEQQSSALHAENVGAVRGSSQDIIAALLDTQEKNKGLASKQDIDDVLGQLRDMHLTSLLEANKPRMMSITDSAAYVGDSIEKLGERLTAKLDDDTADKATKASLQELHGLLVDLMKQLRSLDTAQQLTKLQQTVDNLEVNPMVNVPAPKVTVQSPKLDIAPLQATLEKYLAPGDEAPSPIDLDEYRAQDIDNSNSDRQYIGFLHPNGGWYIIENDIPNNQLRYVFGTDGYAKAFAKAATYDYSLLNEAIDAISS